MNQPRSSGPGMEPQDQCKRHEGLLPFVRKGNGRTWRREYLLGGGHRPVGDLKTGEFYGKCDPEPAQERATLNASRKGPAQRMTNVLAAEFAKLLSEAEVRRSP